MDLRPEISVVIPIYNEQDSVQELHQQLTQSLEGLGRAYEIILSTRFERRTLSSLAIKPDAR
jgi:undecaprenyl-phosphate 4-deoxy-4-formamido-L-arabinose transferase